MMTHSQLLEILTYDHLTGVFTRKIRGGKMPAGSQIGSRHCEGYVEMSVKGERWLAHRLAVFYVTGIRPQVELDVDHYDRVRHNNRWSNIRTGSRSFNLQNQDRRGRSGNLSKRLGVSFHRYSGLWRARVVVEGKELVSYHKSIEDAGVAAIALRVRHYPGFVCE